MGSKRVAWPTLTNSASQALRSFSEEEKERKKKKKKKRISDFRERRGVLELLVDFDFGRERERERERERV
jgi:hypothetical protein